MKLHQQRNLRWAKQSALAFSLSSVLWLAGCSGGNVEQQRAQQSQELAQLREQNKEVQKLRVENKELPRLRKEHEELPQMRGQSDEIEKLRKDNDRIRAEIAAFDKARREKGLQAAQQARQAAASAQQIQGRATILPGVTATNVADANVPQDGDEIFIDPKFLAKILPQIDWSKLERKEPVAIKGMLEQQGIILTNYQQLIDFGITNYTVRHGYKPPATGTVPAPQ